MEELKIQPPDCPAMKNLFDNFDINGIPESRRDAMYKSYTKDYIMSLEYFDDDDDVEEILESNRQVHLNENEDDAKFPVLSVAETIQRIKGSIPSLAEEQFMTITNNGIESMRIDSTIPIFWHQPIFTYIPDESVNIEIINEKMDECGYINVRKAMRKEKNGRQWWFVIYNPNPKYMDDIRDILEGYRLFHFTPEENRKSILDKGLIPSQWGRTYFYPDERVFFVVTDWRRPFKFDKSFLNMMSNISRKMRMISNKDKSKKFSGLYDLFELDITQVPKDVKIYWDPNHNNCVYLNYHLEPEWLTFHEEKSRTFDKK